MSEREPAKGWWQTLPGMLTAVAALLTAVTGVFVALHQIGWLSRDPSGSPAASTSTPAAPAGAQPSTAVSTGAVAVSLPALRDYRLGNAVFTLLGATLSPRDSEANTLVIRVRMRNAGTYPAAEEGELEFAVPRTVTQVRFRISSADEQSDIPLDLAAPPGR